MQKISLLETCFDEIQETNGDDECRAWLNRGFDAKVELATLLLPAGEEVEPRSTLAFSRAPSTSASVSSSAMEDQTQLSVSRSQDTQLRL
jgi:hypothetical protein